MNQLLTSLLILGLLIPNQTLHAVSATANAVCTVIAALAITKASDLDFGDGTQGDSAKTVAAGSSENSENASFDMVGEPSRSFTVTLPSDSTIEMVTGAGDTADKKIAVDSFTSSPSGTGSLDSGGEASLYVGATRAALGASQVAGSYSGTFDVTVVY